MEPSGGPSCLLRRNDFAVKMGRVVSTTERDIIRYYYYFVQQTEKGFAFLRCESSSYDTARHRRGDERLAWGRGKSSGFRTGGPGGNVAAECPTLAGITVRTDRLLLLLLLLVPLLLLSRSSCSSRRRRRLSQVQAAGPGARMSCTALSRSPSTV